MTHDELLVKLMVMGADESEQMRLSKTTQALRAVVQLHKRVVPDLGFENEHITYCEGCSIYEIIDWATCPTIQAIEKELA
jgi:hypothetical protein